MTLPACVRRPLLLAWRGLIVRWPLLGALGLAMVLTGCAGLTTSQAPIVSPASLTAWQGRFSVTYPDPANSGQVQRASGRFRLEQRGSIILLELANPIGQTLANARLESGQAYLTTAEGRSFSAANDQALIEQVFGWRIPVSALPGWLKGQFPNTPRTTSGHAVQLEEAGWAISVSQWQDNRPRVLHLIWPGLIPAGAPNALRLQLIVDAAS